VLLPETAEKDALLMAERLRAAVAAHTVAGTELHLTCSVGVATYPTDGDTREPLIAAADHAMYAAKALGRNQVRAVSDLAVRALSDHSRTATTREETILLGTVEALARV